MSALTQIFDFLFVYLRVFVCYIFGGSLRLDDFHGNQRNVFGNVLSAMGFSSLDFHRVILDFEVNPILILIVGVFALGSIIGLVRRLIK